MFDAELSHSPATRNVEFLNGFLRRHVAQYWKQMFDFVDNNEVDSMDYIWTFSCWANSGLTAIPNVNPVSNIGFDSRATHTTAENGNVLEYL